MTPETIASWRDALGGTRFLLTVGCSAVNSVFFVCGTLTENGYLMILGGTVFTYIASATAQVLGKKDAGP